MTDAELAKSKIAAEFLALLIQVAAKHGDTAWLITLDQYLKEIEEL